MVAGRSGSSIWLIIWAAASDPSWKELISTEVSWGEVSLANKELLKEIMERSSGMESPISRQTRSKVTARMSSLTTTAVGRSGIERRQRKGALSFSDAVISTQ